MLVVGTLRMEVRTIAHPRRIDASSTSTLPPPWLLATSLILNKVAHALNTRLFGTCVDVYNGKTDFLSCASLESKLSSIAGQVSIYGLNIWS
jgi:hypothetical protein